ncbi:hypothetical protein ABZ801_03820 [Actinomadura sp. NPDC047616]
MTHEPNASEPRAEPAVSVVGPDDGEMIFLGTTRMRVLEDTEQATGALAL